ncbi:MAG: recombinase family protein [Synergistaceae bacterium]|nr:recombinase family protein [Synergistaceae bacterium]
MSLNEKEAEIVRIIFEKYADGIGYNQILNYLNSIGYRTKRGNQFGKNSLYSILENEKYVGTYVFNKRLEKNVAGNEIRQSDQEKNGLLLKM